MTTVLWTVFAGCASHPSPPAPEPPTAAIAPSDVPPAPQNPMMTVRGGLIEVALPAEVVDPQRTEILDWVRASADSVGAWYGGFPVPTLRIDVRMTGGEGIGYGTTWAGMPPHIDLPVARGARTADLDRDWVLVHELTHLAFPPVSDQHHWIEEGLATYFEPWERVAAGRLDPALAWHDFVRDLPKGLPNGVGLDERATWASTYWGGALYCLLADLEIRARTGDRLGLRDAAIAMAAGGGMSKGGIHDLEPVLAIGDAAVGVPALTETWRRLAEHPADIDLAPIWRDLGVELRGDTVVFDDAAPRAATRRAIAPIPDPDPRQDP